MADSLMCGRKARRPAADDYNVAHRCRPIQEGLTLEIGHRHATPFGCPTSLSRSCDKDHPVSLLTLLSIALERRTIRSARAEQDLEITPVP
jgi:hypothetical protein